MRRTYDYLCVDHETIEAKKNRKRDFWTNRRERNRADK
jgi:hypothetical protein